MTAADDYETRIVDEDALAAHLESVLGAAAAYDVERHEGGHSNETLFVTWGDRDLVVRRPPPGETADSAHDVLREHTVLSALQDTDVRTPTVVHACADESVIGSEFYVMERLDGDVIREEEPGRFGTPTHRKRLGEELVDALAEVHQVDYEAVGLGDFGHPEGYLERQVDRWWKQYEWAFEVTEEVRSVPAVAEVGEWLEENVPEAPTHTLVHGDYKLDNVLFGPGTPPELAGVFDWEMSTLGDPLADVGWLLHFWRDPDDPDPRDGDSAPAFTGREGYLTRRELVDRYERRTGIEFENARFYRALTAFKMGGIGEMFFRRYVEGNSADPTYPLMEDQVPRRVQRATEFIDADEDDLV
ncbi:MAG: aminoglycoside phosphotransferase (APT) family kinase protein [Natronomonas sp.]|jgi:aminoglycoside phosphotransferase (APT) family kinase protein